MEDGVADLPGGPPDVAPLGEVGHDGLLDGGRGVRQAYLLEQQSGFYETQPDSPITTFWTRSVRK